MNDIHSENSQKIVAVVRHELLPPSETFIRQQLIESSKFHAVLVGAFTADPSLDLHGVDRRSISELIPLPAALVRKVVSRMGVEVLMLRWILRRLNPALVHVHFGLDVVRMWGCLSGLNVPIVVTLHGYDVNVRADWWRSGMGGVSNIRYPENLLQIAADARVSFIAVSEHIRKQAIRLGISHTKIFTRHIGVDLAKFVPSHIRFCDRPMRILFIGRLVEKKGCEVLIKAVARVMRRIPSCELVIVGGGPLEKQYRKLASELGVRALFRGVLTSSQILDEFSTARIFCLPSIVAENGDAEGLPIVLLEAQACGIPVITSAVGGVDEGIIPGQTGIPFEAGDSDGLTEILCSLLPESEQLEAMSVKGRAFVQSKMDVKKCNRDLSELYEEIIRNSDDGSC